MYYQMTVQVARVSEKGWRNSVGLPTFYLRDDIQGITSAADACQIAWHLFSSSQPSDDSTLEAVDITAAGENEDYTTVRYTT